MAMTMSYKEYYYTQMQFLNDFINKKENNTNRGKEALELLQKQQIYFQDEFLKIPTAEKGIETIRLGYKPILNEKGDVDEKLPLILAPDKPNAVNRHLARHRLVYGPVNFYLNFQFEKPTKMPVISACAPNFSGSSIKDFEAFTTGNPTTKNLTLQEAPYTKACEDLATFIIKTAKENGHDKLIMPAFGVGVYVLHLNDESKKKATEIMYRAFAKAAEAFKLKIDWIIWENDPNGAQIQKQLLEYSKAITPVMGDLMKHSEAMLQKGENIALLNPGSDRTVGGIYTKYQPTTLEEQIAQQSDLVLMHSDVNTVMVDKFKKEFNLRLQPPIISKDLEKPEKPEGKQENTLLEDITSVASIIQKTLNTNTSPKIQSVLSRPDNHLSYRVSFDNGNEAEKFVSTLFDNNIKSVKNGGKKDIQIKSNVFNVYLTATDFNHILKIGFKQPEVIVIPSKDQTIAKTNRKEVIILRTKGTPAIKENVTIEPSISKPESTITAEKKVTNFFKAAPVIKQIIQAADTSTKEPKQ